MQLFFLENLNKLARKLKDFCFHHFLVFLQFPEIAFAVFLAPTKYTALLQKLSLPPVINPVFFLFGFISGVIVYKSLRGVKIPNIQKRMLLPYAGLVSLMVISLSYTPNLVYGQSKTLEFITLVTLAYFGPFVIFMNVFAFERFLKTLIAMGIFLSIITLASQGYSYYHFYYWGRSLIRFPTIIGSNYLLVQNIAGMASLIIMYYFLLLIRAAKQKIILIGVLIVFNVALFYAGGKGPILSLFFTILFMLILSVKVKERKLHLLDRKYFAYFMLIIAIGGGLILMPGLVVLKRSGIVLSEGYSKDYYQYYQAERLKNAEVALKLFYEHPIIGVGIGGFSIFSEKTKEEIERFKYPHNIILEIASELGSIGLILFITMLVFTMSKLFYLRKKYKCSKSSALADLLISLIIFSFLTSLTSGDINNIALFVWIGTSHTIEDLLTVKSMQSESES
jgi:O-antigen ligase